MTRKRLDPQPCECQHDAHHNIAEQPRRRSGLPERGYLAEQSHVIRGAGPYPLALCYFCRIHHGVVVGDSK